MVLTDHFTHDALVWNAAPGDGSQFLVVLLMSPVEVLFDLDGVKMVTFLLSLHPLGIVVFDG